jgi:hypothetical protein
MYIRISKLYELFNYCRKSGDIQADTDRLDIQADTDRLVEYAQIS